MSKPKTQNLDGMSTDALLKLQRKIFLGESKGDLHAVNNALELRKKGVGFTKRSRAFIKDVVADQTLAIRCYQHKRWEVVRSCLNEDDAHRGFPYKSKEGASGLNSMCERGQSQFNRLHKAWERNEEGPAMVQLAEEGVPIAERKARLQAVKAAWKDSKRVIEDGLPELSFETEEECRTFLVKYSEEHDLGWELN